MKVSGIKSELIADCARRDRLVCTLYQDTAGGGHFDVAGAAHLSRLTAAMMSTNSWRDFVVDHVVFNTVTAECARTLAPHARQARECLDYIAQVGAESAARGRRWAADLPSTSRASAAQRSDSIRRLCMDAYSVAARHWGVAPADNAATAAAADISR